MSDDINLPAPPDNFQSDDYEESEISNTAQLQSESQIAIQLTETPQPVADQDLDYLNLHDLERSLLKSELSDSQMYLKNIHKGFKFARSTRSLISLVGAGLAVHKHRRQVIKELKEVKKDPFEIDEYGNIKS